MGGELCGPSSQKNGQTDERNGQVYNVRMVFEGIIGCGVNSNCCMYRENEYDEQELTDLLSRIIEISKEVVKVANRAAEACPNRLPKQVRKYYKSFVIPSRTSYKIIVIDAVSQSHGTASS